MFINSHIASGYIASRFDTDDKKWIFLWMFASIIPDIDGLWSKTVVDHHSILHTPFFWIIVCGVGWFIGHVRVDDDIKRVFLIIFLGSLLHLCTDYITARTVGIKWLFPFNTVDYYLFTISPEKGNIPIWEMLVPPYVTFYMENKILTIFEALINIIALVLYFFIYNKTN